mgnify:FL=1
MRGLPKFALVVGIFGISALGITAWCYPQGWIGIFG